MHVIYERWWINNVKIVNKFKSERSEIFLSNIAKGPLTFENDSGYVATILISDQRNDFQGIDLKERLQTGR